MATTHFHDLLWPRSQDQNEVENTDDSDTDSVAGSVRQEDTVSVVDDPADIAMPRAPTLRHAFRNMDDVDVERIFSLRRALVSMPSFSEDSSVALVALTSAPQQELSYVQGL